MVSFRKIWSGLVDWWIKIDVFNVIIAAIFACRITEKNFVLYPTSWLILQWFTCIKVGLIGWCWRTIILQVCTWTARWQRRHWNIKIWFIKFCKEEREDEIVAIELSFSRTKVEWHFTLECRVIIYC